MKVSYFLTRSKVDAETSIYARICYAGFKFKFYIGEQIHPKFWNKDSRQAKQTIRFKEYPEFNTRLDNIKHQIKTVYRQYLNDNEGNIPTPPTLRNLLYEKIRKIEPSKETNKTFFGFLKEIIYNSEKGIRLQQKGKTISQNTIRTYNTLLKHLEDYTSKKRKAIDFDDINLDFYLSYTEFLTGRNATANTIGKDIQIIKLIMNEATERGINKNLAYKSKRFAVIREDVDNIYLNLDELSEMEGLNLSANPRLERVRDLFLVGCFTGLRFSDCSVLKSEQIKNGYIELTQIKTDDPVVIPVHPVVERIIQKYDGKLPPALSNQKTNNYLKEIAQMMPSLNTPVSKTFTKGGCRKTQVCQKYLRVCTHTQRRSFCTNEYLEGTDVLTIMRISGHKTEKSFLRYICVTPKEHAKRLKEKWTERHKQKAA